jgi:uncharacterized damage-inducible protein DinB
MKLREYAVVMAAYNAWMNEKVYAAAAELTDEERKRDLGAAFGSIHRTLNHLVLADLAWLQRFSGQPVTMKSPDQQLYADFEELQQARIAMDADIAAWAETLTEEFGDAPFRVVSVTYKREWVRPTWALVTHLFNHQTHHRAQVGTLLHQLGKDIGVTDLPVLPYFDAE